MYNHLQMCKDHRILSLPLIRVMVPQYVSQKRKKKTIVIIVGRVWKLNQRVQIIFSSDTRKSIILCPPPFIHVIRIVEINQPTNQPKDNKQTPPPKNYTRKKESKFGFQQQEHYYFSFFFLSFQSFIFCFACFCCIRIL